MKLISNTQNYLSSYTFSDLDLLFIVHPIKKDLTLVKDDQAIVKAMRNLVMTQHYERPFRPEIGSNVRNMLFELSNPAVLTLLEREIYDVITNFEPRAKLTRVEAIPEADSVMIDIVYYTIYSAEPKTLQIPLTIGK